MPTIFQPRLIRSGDANQAALDWRETTRYDRAIKLQSTEYNCRQPCHGPLVARRKRCLFRFGRPHRPSIFLLLIPVVFTAAANAQSRARELSHVLQQTIQTPDVAKFQFHHYIFQRIPNLPSARDAASWQAESRRLRAHLLDDVVFHGWPASWISGPPKFEDLGVIHSGDGYLVRKLRYEIVPGFQSTAILYEPQNPKGKAPAILNVNGHEYAAGKAVEYKQKRCINFAKRGIYALSPEWLKCGELNHPENAHEFGSHLDLVGANGVGLFYLAMRRPLDYLVEHPKVDRSRIGVTGLSGGGWQTILLGALDERIGPIIPVAGYSSMISKLEREDDYGDIEQIPTDFHIQADYIHLTAMLAPRPALLIFNSEDQCCYRANLVKQHIYDEIKPFFKLFGKEAQLMWHENMDPGTHNYDLDNRLQAYRFFSTQFGMPVIEDEIPVATEINSYDELVVGLPKNNLTILGVAKTLAARLESLRTSSPRNNDLQSQRTKLKSLVRYTPTSVEHPWGVASTKNKGVETRSYRFAFRNGLSATGVWVKAIVSTEPRVATIVIDDRGKKATAEQVAERVNRGEQVLAVDLPFTGDAAPPPYDREQFALQLSTVGERAIGIQAAQLIALAEWIKQAFGAPRVRVESSGIRSQVVALVTAGLNPNLFSELVIRQGMRSLRHLLDAPVPFGDAPDLFCLDLYKEFDIDDLAGVAGDGKVTQDYLNPKGEH
jgi:dienelactone hydrolase